MSKKGSKLNGGDCSKLGHQQVKKVAEIKYELEYIQAFIKDGDAMAEKEDRSNVVKLWVKQVLEVAERMEDVLEQYKFRVAQLQDDQPLRFKGLLQ